MGSGTANVLTLNGGTIAANANRDFASTRFGGGIVIGGNVQFGELATIVSIASSVANLSFANNVALGAATRTLSIGNNGTTTFSGIISGTSGTGVSIFANANTTGSIILGGVNTYDGPTSISSGILALNATGTIANSKKITISSRATLDTSAKNSFTVGSSQIISGGGTVTVGTGGLIIAGTLGDTGTSILTVSGAGTTFSDGSLFSWDLSGDGASYDKLITSALADGGSGGGSVFKIIAADATFGNEFWNSSKAFADIVGTPTGSTLASIFTTITVVNSNGDAFTPSKGTFSFTGNTLNFTAVPEPSSILAGLLLGAGLLRRNRSQRA